MQRGRGLRQGAATRGRRRRSRSLRALRRGAVCSAAALAILPAAALAQVATKAVTPGTQAQGPTEKCFWGQPEANIGPIDQLGETVGPGGQLGPDTHVAYYYSRFQLPAGATVTLHGQFPHSRFMSFTSYRTVGGEPGIAGTAFSDSEINPDAGSINPFVAGESRKAKNRDFTLTVSGQTAPADPAPNTLYVGQEGHTEETQQVELIERLYRNDKNLATNGGVALPVPTFNPSEGGPVSEEGAVCSALSVVSGAQNIVTTKIGVPSATYIKLRSELPGTKEPATHPATNPIRWERFFNSGYLVAPFYRGTALEGLIPGLNSELKPGFYPTPANAYITAYVSRLFGPNSEGHNILVLHAKMPTHPTTYTKDKINNSAGTQVRYWSLSNYTSISKNTLLEAGSTSLFDQQVPTNIHDEYTIVVSLPEDRPKNAKPGCGVAWMDWGSVGDKEGRPDLDLLTIRNQLSNPTFAQSIEKVLHPGEEEAVMGAYYPTGAYMTKQEFEGRKCWSANS
jgi:hypothetical protein